MGNSTSSSHGAIFIDLQPGPQGPGRYSPGDRVTGTVYMQINEDLDVKAVEMEVYGEEHVQYTTQQTSYNSHNPGHGNHHHPSSHQYTQQHRNNHYIFSAEVTLMHVPNGRLSRGQYSIPISFTLPAGCPPSFNLSTKHSSSWYDVAAGGLRYMVEATCRTSGMHSNIFYECPFDVVGATQQGTPLVVHTEKKVHKFLGMGSAGTAAMELRAPSNVLLAGSTVPLAVKVTNASSKEIERLEAELKCSISIGPKYSTDTVAHAFSAENNVKGDVAIQLPLPPTLHPSYHGNLLRVKYELEVSGGMEGSRSLSAESEVFVYNPQPTYVAIAPPQKPPQWNPAQQPPVMVPPITCK